MPTLDINEDDPEYTRDFNGVWEPEKGYSHLLLGRYREGGHFGPHTDGTNYIDPNRRTAFTTLLYLNETNGQGKTIVLSDNYKEGGFLEKDGKYTCKDEYKLHAVEPRPGRLLCFYFEVPHEAEPVASPNEKYIIRSDIVYKRKEEIMTSDKDQRAYQMWIESQRVAEEDNNPDECVRLLDKACRMSPKLSEILGLG